MYTEVLSPVETRLIMQAGSVYMRYHAFLVLGGFKVENLTPALQARFRETQNELIEELRQCEV
jgi:hypothetical protein